MQASQHRVGSLVPPWGLSHSEDSYLVEMMATSPAGRTKVKLEVEACAAGTSFGDASCHSHVSNAWTELPHPDEDTGKSLEEEITGLAEGTVYHWRARVLYAPFKATEDGIGVPKTPPHGPWRHLAGQVRSTDIRVGLPDDGGLWGQFHRRFRAFIEGVTALLQQVIGLLIP